MEKIFDTFVQWTSDSIVSQFDDQCPVRNFIKKLSQSPWWSRLFGFQLLGFFMTSCEKEISWVFRWSFAPETHVVSRIGCVDVRDGWGDVLLRCAQEVCCIYMWVILTYSLMVYASLLSWILDSHWPSSVRWYFARIYGLLEDDLEDRGNRSSKLFEDFWV